MECNKVEAQRAIDIAESKITENDYVGAKKLIKKAQNLYPNLDGLKQVLMVINVYISAQSNINGGREADWYRILCVDPLADDEAVKKQYKKLALLLHPDKNKCKGAEGAFKLVSEAWSVLSDKVKRSAYDQNRRTKKPPNPHKPASTNAKDGVDPSAKARSDKPAAPVNQTKQRKDGTFWTMCDSCKTQCQYLKNYCLNMAILCPNCGQTFFATEKTPSTSFVSPVNLSSSSSSLPRQASAKRRPLRSFVTFPKSCCNSENVANQAQGRSKRELDKAQETLATRERIRKKLRRDVSVK